MTLSKKSFSKIIGNDYLDHSDTDGENFNFDTFKNDTFESVWVDVHHHSSSKERVKETTHVCKYTQFCLLGVLKLSSAMLLLTLAH